jgi:catechol 2,3-dioxygenase-like lactoylglutathione lyase family enzyme
MGAQEATLHHVGIVVSDLEAAMEEMTTLFGLRWTEPQERPDGERRLRVAFSTSTPRIELIQGNEGGTWTTEGGPRLDHLAFCTPDIDGTEAAAEGRGLAKEAGGTAAWGGKWAYLRLASTGARVELCDERGQERFRTQWGFDEA